MSKKDEIRVDGQIAPGVYRGTRRDENGERPVRFSMMKDGDTLIPDAGGEILSVSPDGCDGWHPVQTLYKSGPAQVATPEYRKGWDRIFGGKHTTGLA